MTDLRITVRNTSENGGTFLTPTYFGFHDGSFDLFEVGEAASAGLEILAEDGGAAGLTPERLAAAPDSQGLVVFGAGGPNHRPGIYISNDRCRRAHQWLCQFGGDDPAFE